VTELSVWLRFVLAALATWRLTHLLSREDGPGDVLVRFRRWLGDGFWGRLLDCFHCVSLWVAAPLSFLVCRRPWDLVLVWLGLSGAACLLERLGEEPVVIREMKPDEEGSDGMLRGEASEDAQRGLRRSEHHPD
jgi:hypothetical protein